MRNGGGASSSSSRSSGSSFDSLIGQTKNMSLRSSPGATEQEMLFSETWLNLLEPSHHQPDQIDDEIGKPDREASCETAAVKEEGEEKPNLDEMERGEDWDGEEDDDEYYLSSESELAEALDFLDAREDAEGGILDGSFTPQHTRRPNAHGGLHSRPNNSSLQPISNKSQKVANHIRASPLEEWEGRFDGGMSNSVTTAIRGSVRDMAIGKTRTTEKADRATVEQAIDPRAKNPYGFIQDA
ncbi:hypothetical protein SASPL_133600 [Salvia splendens]|uniref:Uncharacterized protein n=2 Tax=Salvia splendens TaxID=180675 RepID=A0A8X8ZJA0_SALSN|nr:hypothetical protein SASPL_133600 [Salvia splendens]